MEPGHPVEQSSSTVEKLRGIMGQMASLLTERQHGSFPSNSEENPREKRKEYCKVITLRSGRELEIPRQQLAVEEA